MPACGARYASSPMQSVHYDTLKTTKDGDIAFVRQRFEGICPPLSAVLKLATKCDRWKIAQIPNLPRWTSRTGRTILLGDSAHAMEPNAAQVSLTWRLSGFIGNNPPLESYANSLSTGFVADYRGYWGIAHIAFVTSLPECLSDK